MITYEFLQNYWWLLISVLGATLVFLLFVQGGQTMLISTKDAAYKSMMVNSLGRKWELTFTTLVVFGGAFFASFPLFYSTSFGGAYWLWMIILFSFIVQAISYKYRQKEGNVYGTRTYDTLLFINGIIGPVLLGVAVAMMFFGAEFTVTKSNILNPQSSAISQWGAGHGIEAIFNYKNLLLGFTVLFLSRVQATLYFFNNIDDSRMHQEMMPGLRLNSILFVIFFLAFATMLLTSDGVSYKNGVAEWVSYKYMSNFLEMWWVLIIFLAGTVLVLYAIGRTLFTKSFRKGIWYSGIGTVLVVMSLFWVAGYNHTAYYPSLLDVESSLTIRNSSSSEFTLTVMSGVSLLIPFVLAYIAYAWYALDRVKITRKEIEETIPEEKY